MQTERTFVDEIKYQYKHGGAHMRLIFINTLIFLVIGLLLVIERLSGMRGGAISTFLIDVFTLESGLEQFVYKPWGLVTSIFSHFEFLHFILNMLFLYVSGRMFLQFFSARRLLHVYVIGGIVGGLFELLAHAAFSGLSDRAVVVGASGSIMAIFIALAFYRPSLRISLYGLFEVPLILLAGIYLLSNLVSLGSNDNVAHFSHIGGALVGILSVQNLHASSNIINWSESMVQRLQALFSRLLNPKAKLRVQKGGWPGSVKSDEQYNMEAKERQKRIDAILDKISKSGYESLSKAEKEFLFSQSKR